MAKTKFENDLFLSRTTLQYSEHKVNKRHLWHYTNLAALQGIVESSTLHLTDVRLLNDKNEIKLAAIEIQQFIDDLKPGMHPCIIACLPNSETIENFHSQEYGSTYIASFSSKRDLLSQWKGYAKSRGGIAILFDGDAFHKYVSETDHKEWTYKVIYRKNAKIALLETFFKGLDEIVKSHNSGNLSKKEMFDLRIEIEIFIEDCCVRFKGAEWQEEEESRIIVQGNITSIKPKFKIKDDVITPYLPLPINVRRAIKEVMLLDSSPYIRDLTKQFLEANSLDKVKITKSSLNLRL